MLSSGWKPNHLGGGGGGGGGGHSGAGGAGGGEGGGANPGNHGLVYNKTETIMIDICMSHEKALKNI